MPLASGRSLARAQEEALTERGSTRKVRRLVRNRSALVGAVIVLFITILGVFAPIIAITGPFAVGSDPLMAPGAGYPLGTDNLGRDVFSRFLYGARITLLVGIVAALVSTLIGTVVGMLAGYYGGLLDESLMRITEFFQVIPRFLLALVLAALFGASLWNVILVIGTLSWPLTARLLRAEFLTLREREFVEAARAIGATDYHLMVKEILPNAIAPVIVNGSFEIGRAILLEAGLSFIGLADPRSVTWGTMLYSAQPFLRQAWWLATFPGLGIFVVVWAFNLVGDGLNDALNPRS